MDHYHLTTLGMTGRESTGTNDGSRLPKHFFAKMNFVVAKKSNITRKWC